MAESVSPRDTRTPHRSVRHVKIPGRVTEIAGNRWWAVLHTDEGELSAEMKDPLPEHAEEGSLFTVHRTKRGQTYLYWIVAPVWTRNQIKRIRRRAHARSLLLRGLASNAS